MPNIRLHDLRHTAASLLAQQGVHVTAVSRLLGHSSTSMTLDIYSHAFPDAERDATATRPRRSTATLDRLFGPAVAPQVGEGGDRE